MDLLKTYLKLFNHKTNLPLKIGNYLYFIECKLLYITTIDTYNTNILYKFINPTWTAYLTFIFERLFSTKWCLVNLGHVVVTRRYYFLLYSIY